MTQEQLTRVDRAMSALEAMNLVIHHGEAITDNELILRAHEDLMVAFQSELTEGVVQ